MFFLSVSSAWAHLRHCHCSRLSLLRSYYRKLLVTFHDLNPRRAAARRRTRRSGSVFGHPRLTRLLGHVATRGKRHSKERQKSWRNCFSHFLGQVKGQVIRVTKGRILLISIFFYKAAHNSGTRRATASEKSAFDSSFNVLSPHVLRFHLRSTVWPPESKNSENSRFCEIRFLPVTTFDSPKTRHFFCQHRVSVAKTRRLI